MGCNILAVGDVCGDVGLEFLSRHLRGVLRHYGISFCVVNGENASVKGITRNQALEIFDAGADVITLGNHAFDKSGIYDELDDNTRILRPANYAPQTPGRGWQDYEAPFGTVRVINLIGRCSMQFGPDSPFFEADRILKKEPPKVVLADFHAEATSEKAAMAYYLDGRCTALWGTHTHVQTSDARVFKNGLGFITDIGMTGAVDSIIGVKPEHSLSMFLGNTPRRQEQAEGACKMECAVFEIDEKTGKCLSVEAIRIQ